MYEVGVAVPFPEVAPEAEISEVTHPRACRRVEELEFESGGEYRLWAQCLGSYPDDTLHAGCVALGKKLTA